MKGHLESLSSSEREALSLFVAAIRNTHRDHIMRVVLFGSRARGEGDEDSDIDILVLLRDEEQGMRRSIIDIAGDIFIEKEINISPLVMSSAHFARLRKIERGIALEIERDGAEI